MKRLSIGKPMNYPRPPAANRPNTARPNPTETTPEQNAATKFKRAHERKQAIPQGEQVRNQVQVSSPAPGIVHTRIRPPAEGAASVAPEGSPANRIQSHMNPTAKYDRLTVQEGAQSGKVVTGSDGRITPSMASPEDLGVQKPTAVINGGYFVHSPLLLDNKKNNDLGLYRPVGETSTHDNPVAVPKPYKNDYTKIYEGDQVGVSAGPKLVKDGKEVFEPDHRRFNYRVKEHVFTSKETNNPETGFAGSLAHSNDKNERSALSIDRTNGDLRMHTLTADNDRNNGDGALMSDWTQIVNSDKKPHTDATNLDGGPSVFMGVSHPDGRMQTISQGTVPANRPPREVANVITSQPNISSE